MGVQINKETGKRRSMRVMPNSPSWDVALARQLEAVHITPSDNVKSISWHGLDPEFGGIGGAGQILGGAAGQRFQERSKGYVHVTAKFTSDSYAQHEIENIDDGEFYRRFMQDRGIEPTRLYVYPGKDWDLQVDPDDEAPGRVRLDRQIDADLISIGSRYEDLPPSNKSKQKIKDRFQEMRDNAMNRCFGTLIGVLLAELYRFRGSARNGISAQSRHATSAQTPP